VTGAQYAFVEIMSGSWYELGGILLASCKGNDALANSNSEQSGRWRHGMQELGFFRGDP
jgi:hypothetical protein